MGCLTSLTLADLWFLDLHRRLRFLQTVVFGQQDALLTVAAPGMVLGSAEQEGEAGLESVGWLNLSTPAGHVSKMQTNLITHGMRLTVNG